MHDEPEPKLTWLTVAPAARERGLLAVIIAALRERGVRELASAASGANIASLRRHLSRGFVLAADPWRDAPRPGGAARAREAPAAPTPASAAPASAAAAVPPAP